MPDDVMTRAKQFVGALPHSKALGMKIISAANGRAEMSMPYSTLVVGDPHSKVIFGGAVSALMDTCLGLSVFAHPGVAAVMATLDLRIDYMRASTPNQSIVAIAECYHVTRHVAFVRASAFDEDRENAVASAAATFSLDRSAGAIA